MDFGIIKIKNYLFTKFVIGELSKSNLFYI